MTPQSNDPAEARKRRKEIIQSQRTENELAAAAAAAAAANHASVLSANANANANGKEAGSSPSSLPTTSMNGFNGTNGKIVIIGGTVVAATDTGAAEEQGDDADGKTINGKGNGNGNGAEKKPPKKRKIPNGENGASSSRKTGKKNASAAAASDTESSVGNSKSKKTQIRYDPDVPMSKDQLAAWRREARRVRNRESAAASRQRIRNRISELEDEVGEWKSKYSIAIQRLEALEKCIASKTATTTTGVGQQQQQQQQQEAPGATIGELERDQEPPPQEPPNQPEAVAVQPVVPSEE